MLANLPAPPRGAGSPQEQPRQGRSLDCSEIAAAAITHQCEVDAATLRRVRESYQRCERLISLGVDRRDERRQPFEAAVTVQFTIQHGASQQRRRAEIAVSVWGREIGSNGMSFLASRFVYPVQRIDEQAPILRLERWLTPSTAVLVQLPWSDGLCLGLQARVFCARETYERMYHYTVQFAEKSGKSKEPREPRQPDG
jgi:hypothetical protein